VIVCATHNSQRFPQLSCSGGAVHGVPGGRQRALHLTLVHLCLACSFLNEGTQAPTCREIVSVTHSSTPACARGDSAIT